MHEAFRPVHACFDRRPPQPFSHGFILPRACLLYRAPDRSPAPAHPAKPCDPAWRRKRLPWGSAGPLRDINRTRPPTARSDPSPCYGPPSAFLTPSTAYSASGLAGLFHPAAAYRVPPLRGLSLRPEPHRISPAAALVPLKQHLCGCPRRNATPRLQGLAPRTECGDDRERFKYPDAPRPSRALPSSGYSLSAPSRRFRVASARDLRCNEPAAAGPRRLASTESGWPGIRLPTRSRFAA